MLRTVRAAENTETVSRRILLWAVFLSLVLTIEGAARLIRRAQLSMRLTCVLVDPAAHPAEWTG
jgi:hypothetical protein